MKLKNAILYYETRFGPDGIGFGCISRLLYRIIEM
jgi:hypothetical protein